MSLSNCLYRSYIGFSECNHSCQKHSIGIIKLLPLDKPNRQHRFVSMYNYSLSIHQSGVSGNLEIAFHKFLAFLVA